MIVGFYYPCIGTLKSQIVDGRARSTIYNIFRIPLNLIVASVLLAHIDDIGVKFFIAASLLLFSTFGCILLAYKLKD